MSKVLILMMMMMMMMMIFPAQQLTNVRVCQPIVDFASNCPQIEMIIRQFRDDVSAH